MLGERIKRARAAAGLSTRELAERVALSAMAISKFERGEAVPTSKSLISLARALGTRVEFFLRADTVTLERPEYRKRASLTAKELKRVEADILEQVERFLELLSLFPVSPITPFEVPPGLASRVQSYEDVEQIAVQVREAWQLGLDALPCLAETLETRGVMVVSTAVETGSKFDGLAATVNGTPLVVVGADWPGDRQRFTIAHELGHLVLAGRVAEALDIEKACNRFAGAFLAPKPVVIAELGAHRSSLLDRELYALKQNYGLSMMAWLFRASDCGVIPASVAKSAFIQFTKRGWRTKEPGDPVASETPKLFERLVLRALADDLVSTAKAAELMAMSVSEFRQRLDFEDGDGASHQ